MKEKCENQEECKKMIQAVLDGSASCEEMEHFKNNMESCKPCVDNYELEKAIKLSLQQKIEKKCCPEETLKKLKIKLGISALFVLGILCHLYSFKTSICID